MSGQIVFAAILSRLNLKADTVVFRFCFFLRLIADLNVMMLSKTSRKI